MINNNEVINTLDALGTILKSAIMSLVGMCASWVVSVLYDQSLVVTLIIWVICEIISSIFVRPIVDLIFRVDLKKYSHDSNDELV